MTPVSFAASIWNVWTRLPVFVILNVTAPHGTDACESWIGPSCIVTVTEVLAGCVQVSITVRAPASPAL
jgi:hypothetical protein